MDFLMIGCGCALGCVQPMASTAQALPQTSAQSGANPPRFDLNGEWELRSSSGQKSTTISRIMIQQIGDSIVATSITEGDAVHAGGLAFRGTYRTNNFAIEHLCAQVDSPKPVLTIETVTVIDALHLQIEGGCSNKSIWTRFGNSTIALSTSLLFDVNSSDLRADAQPTLDIIGRMLNELHPGTQLLIAGYTDDLGTEAHNRQLSTRRARAVAAWFQAHGFEKSRITARGYGEKTPRYPNVNDEARAHNRRIEIVVMN
jgi:outer membrane protein OmpA-like peptidoglycan-associated protein